MPKAAGEVSLDPPPTSSLLAFAGRLGIGHRAPESHTLPYLLLTPSMVAMAVIILYPIAFSVWLSLHEVDFLRPQAGRPFIGLQNYLNLFSQDSFWHAVRVTFVYTATAAAASFAVGP